MHNLATQIGGWVCKVSAADFRDGMRDKPQNMLLPFTNPVRFAGEIHKCSASS